MLSEIVASVLERAGDIEIVADDTRFELADLVASSAVHVVVTGWEQARSGEEALLNDNPGLILVAISADGRRASRVRLVGERRDVREVSTRALVEMIREAPSAGPFIGPRQSSE